MSKVIKGLEGLKILLGADDWRSMLRDYYKVTEKMIELEKKYGVKVKVRNPGSKETVPLTAGDTQIGIISDGIPDDWGDDERTLN